MMPWEQAARVYEQEPCARPLSSDLEAHLFHGLVYSTPEAFIMARYVCRDWPEEWIRDPWQNPPGERDCLHVYLAAGDISKFFTFGHFPVKWCSFERGNVLRFHSYQSLKQRCTRTKALISTIP